MNPTHPQTSSRPEKYNLWWLDQNTQIRIAAGVAFYEEKYHEYRLKIDFISVLQEQPSQFYLRLIGAVGDRILYRAEAVMKKDGKYAGRHSVGDGYASSETQGEVYVNFGPFEKTLVLALK